MRELRFACFYILVITVLPIFFLIGCRQEMPYTSIITIEVNNLTTPVNKELYGLTIEEINHAIDGGLYAELIRNRSFEEGVLPLHSAYNASRNVLITPNGWSIPFVNPNSVPGWRTMGQAYMQPDSWEPVNLQNKRSLSVSILTSPEHKRGGVVAEGYQGIAIRQGEKYELSLFVKGMNLIPRPLRIALEDSTTTTPLSDVYTLTPVAGWKRYKHTFTATADTDHAVLTITSDQSVSFALDVVSLFPSATWNGHSNGIRKDLTEKIASLNPKFIRFPGGSFVEGYTNGTYPVWRESLGDISERTHFWNIQGYGSTNGMGYHEFLLLCEELNAEPVYVINSGVTSQSRRPRYENIVLMDKLVQDALDAIAYANEPADSTFGALRAKHGHPEPFDLKFIEVGSENYGHEYTRRFNLFRSAIQKVYPDVTIISSSALPRRHRNDWEDEHYYADDLFFISKNNYFESENFSRRSPFVFIGEMGTVTEPVQGTLRAAVGEACFLMAAERKPDIVKRMAYSPLLGNADYEYQRSPMIEFKKRDILLTPSYYVWELFANNRGDELLQMSVDTYNKPQITGGYASVELFDNSYEIKDVMLDGSRVGEGSVLSGGWKIADGELQPAANRWNYILLGDSSRYNYEFTATIRRTKGSGQIQFRVRDKGKTEEQSNYICMTIGLNNVSECYQQVGSVKDVLAPTADLPFESRRWYQLRISCKDDHISCYVDDQLVHDVQLPSLPSVVSLATLDKENNCILLKMVNTTQHEERTRLNIQGASVNSEAEVWEITGKPEARNSFEQPEKIVPVYKQVTFSIGSSNYHLLPPNSVTLMKLYLE